MYKLTDKKIVVENQQYTVYGIKYNDTICIDDISTDKNKVEKLISDCNNHELDPIHLADIVEDFLS